MYRRNGESGYDISDDGMACSSFAPLATLNRVPEGNAICSIERYIVIFPYFGTSNVLYVNS
ncbi:hypothetical protein C0J52_05111 [Blattella germanica]|nr:hypothetical protein C0J52_05111 [Blattella germanica]